MNPSTPFATHVAVRQGRILSVGTEEGTAAFGPAEQDDPWRGSFIVPGEPPSPLAPPPGCHFAGRRTHTQERCGTAAPTLWALEAGHWVACRRAEELAHLCLRTGADGRATSALSDAASGP